MTIQIPVRPGASYAYDLRDGTTVYVSKVADGWYGETDDFDFHVTNALDLTAKLAGWGAQFVGVEAGRFR